MQRSPSAWLVIRARRRALDARSLRSDALGRLRFAAAAAVVPAIVAAYAWNTLVLRDLAAGAVWAWLAAVLAGRGARRLAQEADDAMDEAGPWLVIGPWPVLAAGAMTLYLVPFAGPTTRTASICAWIVALLLPSAGYNASLAAGLSRERRRERTQAVARGTTAVLVGALTAAGIAFAMRPSVPAVYGAQNATSSAAPALETAAGRLAGQPVTVDCLSRTDWSTLEQHVGDGPLAGVTPQVGTGVIDLRPEVCDMLLGLQDGRFEPSARYPNDRRLLAAAVAVLAHEVQHVRGVANEAVAECYATQRVQRLAELLGASPSYARSLARVYWLDAYPRDPARYRTGACREGGPFDLPGAWP
jgi:hypothetical protein